MDKVETIKEIQRLTDIIVGRVDSDLLDKTHCNPVTLDDVKVDGSLIGLLTLKENLNSFIKFGLSDYSIGELSNILQNLQEITSSYERVTEYILRHLPKLNESRNEHESKLIDSLTIDTKKLRYDNYKKDLGKVRDKINTLFNPLVELAYDKSIQREIDSISVITYQAIRHTFESYNSDMQTNEDLIELRNVADTLEQINSSSENKVNFVEKLSNIFKSRTNENSLFPQFMYANVDTKTILGTELKNYERFSSKGQSDE